ncbi:hypothetical protein BU23DRAFT_597735 [Bimuria novae-zelandiae CBS 107.79]|uniref:Uncharacterized protein n=1 Tax=Bimuria novae-zelandiae CBS 107.79 TaxID=1447943 RepID=A0A6A5VQT8_9PLEO|nr:hypothetical protein BU23DRAFT_597735 [Bimuria novae-zelandiae CBS 107.79]
MDSSVPQELLSKRIGEEVSENIHKRIRNKNGTYTPVVQHRIESQHPTQHPNNTFLAGQNRAANNVSAANAYTNSFENGMPVGNLGWQQLPVPHGSTAHSAAASFARFPQSTALATANSSAGIHRTATAPPIPPSMVQSMMNASGVRPVAQYAHNNMGRVNTPSVNAASLGDRNPHSPRTSGVPQSSRDYAHAPVPTPQQPTYVSPYGVQGQLPRNPNGPMQGQLRSDAGRSAAGGSMNGYYPPPPSYGFQGANAPQRRAPVNPFSGTPLLQSTAAPSATQSAQSNLSSKDWWYKTAHEQLAKPFGFVPGIPADRFLPSNTVRSVLLPYEVLLARHLRPKERYLAYVEYQYLLVYAENVAIKGSDAALKFKQMSAQIQHNEQLMFLKWRQNPALQYEHDDTQNMLLSQLGINLGPHSRPAGTSTVEPSPAISASATPSAQPHAAGSSASPGAQTMQFQHEKVAIKTAFDRPRTAQQPVILTQNVAHTGSEVVAPQGSADSPITIEDDEEPQEATVLRRSDGMNPAVKRSALTSQSPSPPQKAPRTESYTKPVDSVNFPQNEGATFPKGTPPPPPKTPAFKHPEDIKQREEFIKKCEEEKKIVARTTINELSDELKAAMGRGDFKHSSARIAYISSRTAQAQAEARDRSDESEKNRKKRAAQDRENEAKKLARAVQKQAENEAAAIKKKQEEEEEEEEAKAQKEREIAEAKRQREAEKEREEQTARKAERQKAAAEKVAAEEAVKRNREEEEREAAERQKKIAGEAALFDELFGEDNFEKDQQDQQPATEVSTEHEEQTTSIEEDDGIDDLFEDGDDKPSLPSQDEVRDSAPCGDEEDAGPAPEEEEDEEEEEEEEDEEEAENPRATQIRQELVSLDAQIAVKREKHDANKNVLFKRRLLAEISQLKARCEELEAELNTFLGASGPN